MFNMKATVNYADGDECDTPDFDNLNQLQLVGLIQKLVAEDADATSFVIVVTKNPTKGG